ncbi:hypothetical protein POF50_033510 [Streptomyces sp. SL13]|jgi:hypothetical protein|uniref:Uncharacterized protein n=1 Tax=Streptantibioticus silvisoli TaxID=2705255 RepID=A0AA90HD61_9ACTN|nr:hypothetical protein [Streptantibioticus silvisoli]MDI5966966.1 hypothetical protein [Streptantibioticus silvisoli]MDI5974207.1 hypothetical protein [Streptantibioticus silvisoli]
MLWLMLCTALAFCGIAVLGVLGVRVYLETGRLARQIAASSQALGTAADRFQRTAEPLAARAGDLARR